MSSITTMLRDDLFQTFQVSLSDAEDKEAAEEKPTEQTTTKRPDYYLPKRASFHSLSGKMKRFFA
jgi:hypothetical protein